MTARPDVHTREELDGQERASMAIARRREEGNLEVLATREAFALERLSDDEFKHALELAKTKQRRVKQVVMNLLEEDVHYGKVPGIPKPFAWQGAGDEIRRIYRWAARPSGPAHVEQSQEYVSAIVTVGVFDNVGNLLLERSASCNTREKRFKNQKSGAWSYVDAREKLHECITMAEKRATLKCTLAAAGATTYFANPDGLDAEDTPPWTPEEKSAFQKAAAKAGIKSGAQLQTFVITTLGAERPVLQSDIPRLYEGLANLKNDQHHPVADPVKELFGDGDAAE